MVLLVHGFPSFLIKPLNMSDNCMKFIPVETGTLESDVLLPDHTLKGTEGREVKALKLVCPILHLLHFWQVAALASFPFFCQPLLVGTTFIKETCR